MTAPTAMPESLPAEWKRAFAWIEAELGGRIVRAQRQARWRPAWFLDLERDGGTVPLYFRGDRAEADHGAYALEHEMRVLQVLEGQEVPVPHVYGFCPEPRGILMERCPGRANLLTAADDAERESVLDDYMEILARIHAIDPAAFEKIGLERPTSPQSLGLGDLDIWERGFRKNKCRPEPLIEFVIGWVRRNVPHERAKVSFLCADAGQFLFEDGRVTAVLDLELACFGDPAADLGGMRCRDLSEPLGDLTRAVHRYEAITGEPVDRSVIDFHTVRFSIVTPLATAHLVANPPPGLDFVQYLAWYLVYGRAPIEVIAREMGLDLAPVEVPGADPTRHSQGHDAMRDTLEGHAKAAAEESPDDEFAAYRFDAAQRLAEYLRRADRFGPALEADDLDDVAELLGHRPDTWQRADAELEALVLEADPDLDGPLIRYFHKRMLRQESLIDPVMRELRGASIQPIG
ncbi:MAG: phosphotransferase family protein [Myxococcota bacterium]|nr:phosphotransferase family protein [Myxococcota bacterium]